MMIKTDEILIEVGCSAFLSVVLEFCLKQGQLFDYGVFSSGVLQF